MKKTILALSLSLLCVMNVNAQNKTNFEGVIIFSISFEGSGLPPEAAAMLKGAETVIYIKADKQRVDMTMPMQSTSTFTDNKSKNSVTLMDIMGKKYLIKMNEAEIKKEQETAPEIIINNTDETKIIAGYKCKKAEITVKSGGEKMINVFYTEEIPTNETKPVFNGLKGVPLEYSVTQGGMEMKFTAKSITKESVSDSKFEIPKEGYIETTIEDLQKTMLKQMGGR